MGMTPDQRRSEQQEVLMRQFRAITILILGIALMVSSFLSVERAVAQGGVSPTPPPAVWSESKPVGLPLAEGKAAHVEQHANARTIVTLENGMRLVVTGIRPGLRPGDDVR